MKIRTGQVVRGRDFFPRDKEVLKLWRKIENGNSILISAPRRVGKTSLMKYIEDNPKNDYIMVYIVTESINNENDFYKKIYQNLVSEETLASISTSLLSISKNYLNKLSELGLKSIKIDSVKELDYYKELINFIKKLKIEPIKLIIMIDEFPQTLENIINEQGNKQALHFLQTNRELRQDSNISDKVQFIYTGSIGLENIVSTINAINLINDIDIFHLQPLEEKDAIELINKLLDNLDFELDENIISYILNKIKWYIPYYIQLILDEISNIYEDKELEFTDESIVDIAFKQLLEQRIYFEHWYKRLDKSYKDNYYKFAKELLNYISKNDCIIENELINLAIGLNIQNNYKDIINALKHDGYIHLDNNEYKFNSPLLKIWWLQNVSS
ncbi:MAG: ATP-binding protein [Candidatus Sericytochromatia bacterium]